MKKNSIRRISTTILALCALCINTYANDGGYFVSGNHLIPISNTDIKIAKEVLTIKLSDTTEYTYVDVDYTFVNNSSKPKTVKMGFEAELEDLYKLPEEGTKGHPYIYDFTVELNGKHVNHTNEFAFYSDSEGLDYKNFPVDKTKWILGGDKYEDDGGWDRGLMNVKTKEFYAYAHVYYFEVTFKPGENKIHHTYRYLAGMGQEDAFTVKYWLKPAMRWEGNKIEDFTLRISAENTAKDFILNGPFDDKGSFRIASGTGKTRISKYGREFVIRNGVVEYNCKDFIPNKDLLIKSPDTYIYKDHVENNTEHVLGEFYDRGEYYWLPMLYGEYSDWSKRILRNLPYASRGYVFKDKKLADYFSQFFWYMPDPSWTPSQADFTEWERNFVKSFSRQ